MKRLWVDPKRCTGCAQCMKVCSLRRGGACGSRGAALRVLRDEVDRMELPLVCLLCRERPCIEACEVGALRTTPRRLALRAEICTACGRCARACPYGLLHLTDGRPEVCDLCRGRPACVRFCPTGALSYEDEAPSWETARDRYLRDCRAARGHAPSGSTSGMAVGPRWPESRGP